MKIHTELISGAGNTFHIAYGEGVRLSLAPDARVMMKKIVKQACEQQAADGFIFLEHSQKTDNQYEWHFFNRDSSDAEMCGNATRCVGYYIHNHLKDTGTDWKLQTVAGAIQIKFVEKEMFEIKTTPIKALPSSKGFFCDTGVPHLVLSYEGTELFLNLNENLKNKSSQLRHHQDFAPKGTNVTYVQATPRADYIRAVSFERGVEDFTKACGTGAMAAAYFNLTKRGITQTQVEMPGGTLMMNLTDLNEPKMTGPAVLLGSYDHEIAI